VDKSLLGKIALVVALLGTIAAAVWWSLRQADENDKLTAPAVAEVVTRRYEKDRGLVHLRYRFQADGKTFEGRGREPGRRTSFRPGEFVNICYDPVDPAHSDTAGRTPKCPPYKPSARTA
jgi:hypothetical protein